MPARDFTIEDGRSGFTTENTWRLMVPPGPPPPGGRPLIVCLHGMGMSGEQFRLILNDLAIPPAAWLFPDGVFPYEIRSEGKITIGHAWYLYDGNEEPFRSTLTLTEGYVFRLVDEISHHAAIDPARVWLLGFSQGAYTAFFIALRNMQRIAGLVAISGRMRADFVADEIAGSTKIPILMVHGEKDRNVPLERAMESFRILEDHGFPIEMKTLPVGHMIRAVELDVIREWLGPRLT